MTPAVEREISARECARRLGVGMRRMLWLLHNNKIPTAVQEHEGGRWYVQPRGLLQYTEERGR